MKKIYFIAFTLAVSISIFAQHTTITEWNFESLSNSHVPSPAPSSGTGTASIVGSMSTSGSGTVQGGTCANTSGNVAWNISSANPGTINESSGVQFLVSTAGFTNIKFSFSHRVSNTSTRTVRVQYTTDGGSTWTNYDLTVANYSQTCPNRGGLDNFRIDAHSTVGNAAGDTWKNVTVDFSTLLAANNQSGFGVRLVAAHYSTTGQFRQAQNSSNVATGGAWRFDNVKFEGVASLPTVSFNTASSTQTEGNAGFVDVDIPVTISSSPTAAVNVNVSVSGSSTATSGVDFNLLTPVLTFNPAPAPTTQNVTVRVFGDVVGELDETVILNLAIGSGPASLGSITAHTLTIQNDDPNTYYSCNSGLTNAAIWSLNDPTCATTTTAVFSSSNSFVIQSGHTIQLHASPLSMKSLDIMVGGKLWRNSNVPGNMRYINVYDYVYNDGTFGNDVPSFDAIGINAEGANVSISGGGTWNFGRIRKNTISPHSTTNLTISDGVFNLYFPGTAIYNDPTNTSLFISITGGTTVNVYEGNVAIDGTTGLSSGESFGGITVSGTLNLDKNGIPNRGKFFGMCNNVTAGVCSLTINPGGLVVVDEFDFNNNVTGATTQFTLNLNGGQLHIREALNLFDGTFTGTDDVVFLSPDANTCAIIDNFTSPRIGNYTGTGTFQRGYNASNIYNQLYFSSPVNALNITDLAPASGTNGVAVTPTSDCDETQLASNSNYGNVFEYNENLVSSCYLQAWVVRSSGTADNGRGYSVVKSGSGQLQIEGAPNLAPSYTIPNLGNSAWSLPTKQNTAPNATVGGWHLLGNPYPSNLDPVNPDPTEFGNVFKVLDAVNSIYVDRTFSSADLLPPFQGFFVYKLNNGGTANFSIIGGSNRSRTPTTFFKNSDPLKQLKIKIAGNGKFDECYVNIIPGASASFDLEFDGYKWFSHSSFPAVYTSFNNELFSTNTIGSVEETPVIPLNFRVPATDVYQLEISGFENLTNMAKVIIEDKLLKKSYEFTQNGEFLFNATKNDNADRFNIRFVSAAVSSVSDMHNPLKVFAANKVLNVDLGTHGINGKVEVFNALGELVKEFQTNTSFSQFDISSIGSGTFIAKVSSDNGSLTKKFVIAD